MCDREMAFNSMRPASFEGLNDSDPDEWINGFERYVALAEWQPQRKLAAFRSMLQGRAGRWLTEVGAAPADEDPYDWIRARFVKKFGLSSASRFRLRTELINIKQGPDSVATYLERVEQKCHPLNLDEQAKLDFFTQGLRGQIQAHVLRTQPGTLDGAINAAKAEEAAQAVAQPDVDSLVEKLVGRLAHLRTTRAGDAEGPPANVHAVKATNAQHSLTCQLCGTDGHPATACPSST